jgi:hypothetical protein
LLRRPLIGLLCQLRRKDENGAVGEIRIGRWNRSTRRKPSSVPLCAPQISHGIACDRTWSVAVGSRRPTTWAMYGPVFCITDVSIPVFLIEFLYFLFSNSAFPYIFNLHFIQMQTSVPR